MLLDLSLCWSASRVRLFQPILDGTGKLRLVVGLAREAAAVSLSPLRSIPPRRSLAGGAFPEGSPTPHPGHQHLPLFPETQRDAWPAQDMSLHLICEAESTTTRVPSPAADEERPRRLSRGRCSFMSQASYGRSAAQSASTLPKIGSCGPAMKMYCPRAKSHTTRPAV